MIIALPEKFRFSKIGSFRLERKTNIIKSMFTAKRQVLSLPFAVWYLEADLLETISHEKEGREIRAFLAQLEGQANTFRLPVPGYTLPSTGYNANCLSNGVTAARAKSIAVDGLANNSNILNKGDYFTVADELKIVTNNVTSNGTGQATIEFQPPLRKQIANNSAVTIVNPTCLMSALEDDVADWQLNAPIKQRTKFEAVEAF